MSSDKWHGERIYTRHGRKHIHGVAFRLDNGMPALGYQDGDEIVGYSTFAELTEKFFDKDLPTYNPEKT